MLYSNTIQSMTFCIVCGNGDLQSKDDGVLAYMVIE
jgi:hypothetical protein